MCATWATVVKTRHAAVVTIEWRLFFTGPRGVIRSALSPPTSRFRLRSEPVENPIQDGFEPYQVGITEVVELEEEHVFNPAPTSERGDFANHAVDSVRVDPPPVRQNVGDGMVTGFAVGHAGSFCWIHALLGPGREPPPALGWSAARSANAAPDSAARQTPDR